MKKNLLMLSGLFVTAGVISCGGGGGGGTSTTDLTNLSKDQVYTAISNFNSSMKSSFGVTKGLSGAVGSGGQQSAAFKLHSLILQSQKEGITSNATASYSCKYGGTVDLTMNPSDSNGTQGTFSATFNNCNEEGIVMDGTITGSYSSDEQNMTYSYSMTFKSGFSFEDTNGNISGQVKGDLSMSSTFTTNCQDAWGIKSNMTVDGGPITITENNATTTVAYSELKIAMDFMCTEYAITSSVEGIVRYEDNFCINSQITFEITTPQDIREDNSGCSGKLSINKGQVEIVFNKDCSVSFYHQGKEITTISSDEWYDFDVEEQCQVPAI